MTNDWTEDKARFGRLGWLLQPGFWPVAIYRFGRWTICAPRLIRPFVHGMYFSAYSVSRLIYGIDIPRSAKIGPGLMIHHFGGIIVHPQAQIGRDCTLRHGVTIGVRRDGGVPPRLGDRIVLGAYAQILGDITVGDGAEIGAMSLVISDVPPGAIAVGIPARIVRLAS